MKIFLNIKLKPKSPDVVDSNILLQCHVSPWRSWFIFKIPHHISEHVSNNFVIKNEL